MGSRDEQRRTASGNEGEDWRALIGRLAWSWFIYVGVWLTWLVGLVIHASGREVGSWFGMMHMPLIVVFLVTLNYASKVQKGMREEGLSKGSPGAVVAAGLLLNPLIGGFYPPLSVLISARRARRSAAVA
ncbi:MAG: hypothetical protein KC583_03640 [Myxococcales bacterium]|nr:hypothetical protein [Myxococcales bacterium]